MEINVQDERIKREHITGHTNHLSLTAITAGSVPQGEKGVEHGIHVLLYFYIEYLIICLLYTSDAADE